LVGAFITPGANLDWEPLNPNLGTYEPQAARSSVAKGAMASSVPHRRAKRGSGSQGAAIALRPPL
jgi:hypothetical protein